MAAIELDGLTKDYGEVLAADDLTFTVERGEAFGYLGPNGAGKTTTIRLLLGFIRPTAGTGTVLGHDIRDRKELLEAKRRVGYLSDEPGFDERATGEEILELHGAVKGDRRSEELLELFDPPLERRVREYSRGNVQKLGLVTTFMHEPDLVLLDEPTSGLDPLMKQRFAEFLRAEQERGVTVFFSSHILSEVRRLCDRVGIIRAGRLVTIEPIESLLDRSGKVVRLDARRPLPLEILDIEGVHDLESSVSGGWDVDDRQEVDDRPDVDDRQEVDGERDADDRPDVDGGHEVDGERDVGPSFTECAFTFTGDIDALLDVLAAHEFHDVSIEEAPLEDVFMRFYGGDDDV